MKATKVLIIYVCVLLLMCLLAAVFPNELFTDNKSISTMNVKSPDNQLCGTVVKNMFPNYTFSDKAKNVIGTLKPDVTTTYDAIGFEPNMNFQCVIPNYPLNPLNITTTDGSFYVDTSSDLKIFNIDVKQQSDGRLRCVGKSSDGKQQVDMPYRDENTSLRGCTINIPSYKDTPKNFEKDLEALYDISREEYVQMLNIKKQEIKEAVANKNFFENVNNNTLQQATQLENNANNTKNDTKTLLDQIDSINKKISQERERQERERLERERMERERLERMERERMENERLENERLENERLENERLENERLEKERLEKERLEKERLRNPFYTPWGRWDPTINGYRYYDFISHDFI
jgi:hypothetical protein